MKTHVSSFIRYLVLSSRFIDNLIFDRGQYRTIEEILARYCRSCTKCRLKLNINLTSGHWGQQRASIALWTETNRFLAGFVVAARSAQESTSKVVESSDILCRNHFPIAQSSCKLREMPDSDVFKRLRRWHTYEFLY